jgi:hypothetical protein
VEDLSDTDVYMRLDRIVSAIESDLLAASDTEILSDKRSATAEKRVRKLVDARVAIHEREIVAPIPANADDRRLLFEILARNTSGVPREVRMAYGTGRKLSNRQVSVLLQKLLHGGFFSSVKKK